LGIPTSGAIPAASGCPPSMCPTHDGHPPACAQIRTTPKTQETGKLKAFIHIDAATSLCSTERVCIVFQKTFQLNAD